MKKGMMVSNLNKNTARKVAKYRVFSGPYFPVFGQNSVFFTQQIVFSIQTNLGIAYMKVNV